MCAVVFSLGNKMKLSETDRNELHQKGDASVGKLDSYKVSCPSTMTGLATSLSHARSAVKLSSSGHPPDVSISPQKSKLIWFFYQQSFRASGRLHYESVLPRLEFEELSILRPATRQRERHRAKTFGLAPCTTSPSPDIKIGTKYALRSRLPSFIQA